MKGKSFNMSMDTSFIFNKWEEWMQFQFNKQANFAMKARTA